VLQYILVQQRLPESSASNGLVERSSSSEPEEIVPGIGVQKPADEESAAASAVLAWTVSCSTDAEPSALYKVAFLPVIV
jgi:hypothetical protein